MSLFNWLKIARPPATLGLPHPGKDESAEEYAVIQSANDFVDKEPTRKCQRGEYSTYSAETRANIAKSAINIGNSQAAQKWSKSLGRKINESTVRSIKRQYLKHKTLHRNDELPHKPRGPPLVLGEKMDRMVQSWVRKVRIEGGVINTRIVMAAAQGIMSTVDRKSLAKHGGHITITNDWGRSLLRWMNFVKRKGTKEVKRLPDDFQEIKAAYNKRVQDARTKIPEKLVKPRSNWV